MPIELMAVCIWRRPNGSGYDRVEASNPDWEQVQAVIRALDGLARNDLYLMPKAAVQDVYLAIGGGTDGHYVATGATQDRRFPTVFSGPPTRAARVEIMVGGQMCDFPRHCALNLETALLAAKSFVETGRFGGGGLLWSDE